MNTTLINGVKYYILTGEDSIWARNHLEKMQLTNPVSKDFTPAEWAKFNNKRARELRRELKRIDGHRRVTANSFPSAQKSGFPDNMHPKDHPYEMGWKYDLNAFLVKRTKLVLMEFPKTN